jgi:hypothetical protein
MTWPMSAFRPLQTFSTPMRYASAMRDEPEQKALFHIEGPDEDGCVWICSPIATDGDRT